MAWSQVLQNEAGYTGPEAAEEQWVSMQVKAQESVELPSGDVREVKYDLKGIEIPEINTSESKETSEFAAAHDTKGIVVEGYTRVVDAGDVRIGQVMFRHLEKEGQSVEIDCTHFSDQFEMPDAQLRPDQELRVKANRSRLLKAINELNEKVASNQVASSSERSEEEEDTDYITDGNEERGGVSGHSGNKVVKTGETGDFGFPKVAAERDKAAENGKPKNGNQKTGAEVKAVARTGRGDAVNIFGGCHK